MLYRVTSYTNCGTLYPVTTLLKVIKVALFLMLLILAIDFKEVTKTSFCLKTRSASSKVHIAIVVGPECGSSEKSLGHNHGGQWTVEPGEGCNSSYRVPLRQR